MDFETDGKTGTVLATLAAVGGAVGLYKLGKTTGYRSGYAEGWKNGELETLRRELEQNRRTDIRQ